MKVSLVIPSYNRFKYLKRMYRFTQRYEQNLDIIYNIYAQGYTDDEIDQIKSWDWNSNVIRTDKYSNTTPVGQIKRDAVLAFSKLNEQIQPDVFILNDDDDPSIVKYSQYYNRMLDSLFTKDYDAIFAFLFGYDCTNYNRKIDNCPDNPTFQNLYDFLMEDSFWACISGMGPFINYHKLNPEYFYDRGFGLLGYGEDVYPSMKAVADFNLNSAIIRGFSKAVKFSYIWAGFEGGLCDRVDLSGFTGNSNREKFEIDETGEINTHYYKTIYESSLPAQELMADFMRSDSVFNFQSNYLRPQLLDYVRDFIEVREDGIYRKSGYTTDGLEHQNEFEQLMKQYKFEL